VIGYPPVESSSFARAGQVILINVADSVSLIGVLVATGAEGGVLVVRVTVAGVVPKPT